MFLPVVEPKNNLSLWHGNTYRAHTVRAPKNGTGSSGNGSGNGRGSAFESRLGSGYSDASFGATIRGNQADGMLGDNYVPSIDDQEKAYEEQMYRIRMYGWEYLKPPGVGKTLQVMLEDLEEFADEDAEEAMPVDGMPQEEVTEFDNNTNFVPPVRMNDVPSPDGSVLGDGEDVDEENDGEVDDNVGEEDEEGEEGDVPNEVDLDAEIQEAGDNEYGYDESDDEHDEGAYDEGFMAEEDEAEMEGVNEATEAVAEEEDSVESEEFADENEVNRQSMEILAHDQPTNPNALQQIAVENVLESESDESDEELVFSYEPLKKDEVPEQEGERSQGSEEDGEGDMSF